MKKTDIEKILKQGSIKQKIKLYYTDIAYFNTKGIITAELKGSGTVNARMHRPDKILTDKERDLILNSIKEPKDIKYYNDLALTNKAFLMFKPLVTLQCKYNLYLTSEFKKIVAITLIHKGYEDSINEILEEINNKKTRDKVFIKALDSLQKFDATVNKGKDNIPTIEIKQGQINDDFIKLIATINTSIRESKEYIETISFFVKKSLPLQPYKQFLKDAENEIKKNIDICKKISDTLIKSLKYKDLKEDIINWEDVEVIVSNEDINDIKNAGL